MFVEGLRCHGTNTWVPGKEPTEGKMLVTFSASYSLKNQEIINLFQSFNKNLLSKYWFL